VQEKENGTGENLSHFTGKEKLIARVCRKKRTSPTREGGLANGEGVDRPLYRKGGSNQEREKTSRWNEKKRVKTTP